MEIADELKIKNKTDQKAAELKPKKTLSKEKDTKHPTLKKLDPDAIKLLIHLKEKANKKEFGRKIRDAEIISLGLTLIQTEHIEKLQENTYSEQDRLKFAHLEHQKRHGKISLDQFIGKLLRGEISTSNA